MLAFNETLTWWRITHHRVRVYLGEQGGSGRCEPAVNS